MLQLDIDVRRAVEQLAREVGVQPGLHPPHVGHSLPIIGQPPPPVGQPPPPVGQPPPPAGQPPPPAPPEWPCPKCGEFQFAGRQVCRSCGAIRPDLAGEDGERPSFIRAGDWNCPGCGDLQFGRNRSCRKCGGPRPSDAGSNEAVPRLPPAEDWTCPDCDDKQCGRNRTCRRCGCPRPKFEPKPREPPPGVRPEVFVDAAALAASMQGGIPPDLTAYANLIGGSSSSGDAASAKIVSKPGDWLCPSCGDLVFQRNNTCRRCGQAKPEKVSNAPAQEFKAGDWRCLKCGELVFAKNLACRKCGAPRPGHEGSVNAPGNAGGLPPYAEPGDWKCPGCSDIQFKRNPRCRRCDTPRPFELGEGERGSQIQKPGDWPCPGCGDMQFARNVKCRKCSTPRPADWVAPNGKPWVAEPGDWLCPNCNDLQFKRNSTCRKCRTPRPPEAGAAGVMTGMVGPAGGLDELEQAVEYQQAAAYIMQQHRLAEEEQARQEEEQRLQARLAQLALTVRVNRVPVSMSTERLLMIFTGMFGEVKDNCVGLDFATQHPFAVIEFKEAEAAAMAVAAAKVQFGADCLEIVASTTTVAEGADAATVAAAKAASGKSNRDVIELHAQIRAQLQAAFNGPSQSQPQASPPVTDQRRSRSRSRTGRLFNYR